MTFPAKSQAVPKKFPEKECSACGKKTIDTSMRARQLVSTVRQGRKIVIGLLTDEEIEGYLSGWDDDTYFLVYGLKDKTTEEEIVVQVLVPKRAISYIEMMGKRTFREDALYDMMNSIVKPFRDRLVNDYFTQG